VEVLKVKVFGGSKRKVLTKVRHGDVVERYEVRWRVYFIGGEMRELRQRFDRAVEADQFIRVLGAVGLPGSTWRMGDDGRPYDASARPVVPEEPQGPSVTMWDALQMYRSATWRTASANGRKTHAYVLRAMARVTTDRAPTIPPAAEAYLATIAFRAEHEPTDRALTRIKRHRSGFTGAELLAGRQFLEKWSLPVSELTTAHVRRLIAEVGTGRASSTEGRRWGDMRTVLRWWVNEDLIEERVITRVGRVRGTVIEPPGEDDPIPTEAEMWAMAWALCLVGQPRYAALPFVMGGGGLRAGECFALRRRDCIDEPGGGMWLTVRRSYSKPGKDWTTDGAADEHRGTKAKGPDGDRRGRRTYLPPVEASILRTHIEHYTARDAEALVFTTSRGKPVDIAHLQERAWQRARDLAFPVPHRLNSVGRHAFRHLAATRWLRAGVPLKTAAKWGGWKDTTTMLRWYEARLPGDDDLAASRMSA